MRQQRNTEATGCIQCCAVVETTRLPSWHSKTVPRHTRITLPFLTPIAQEEKAYSNRRHAGREEQKERKRGNRQNTQTQKFTRRQEATHARKQRPVAIHESNPPTDIFPLLTK